jgi:hypothetical protein
MEPEGSLPCSKEPSTGSYPEPDQSSHTTPTYLSKIHFIITYLRLGLPSGLFPSALPTKILYAFRFSPFVLHALPITHNRKHYHHCYYLGGIKTQRVKHVTFLRKHQVKKTRGVPYSKWEGNIKMTLRNEL